MILLLVIVIDGCITMAEERDCGEEWRVYTEELNTYHALQSIGVGTTVPSIPQCDLPMEIATGTFEAGGP